MARSTPATLLLVFVPFTSLAAAETTTEIVVDCDRGDDLARALAQASQLGQVTVRVTGTCQGSFKLRGSSVSLIGESPRTATLVGVHGLPVLEVADGEDLKVEGLTIRGGYVGIHARAAWAASVTDCIVRENDAGMFVTGGAVVSVTGTTLEESLLGMLVHLSEVKVDHSIVHNNQYEGIRAELSSRASVTGSEITGNGTGLSALRDSTLDIFDCTVTDNDAHLYLFGGSHANLLSTVGLEGDDSPAAVVVDGSSLLADGTIHGRIRAFNDAFVRFGPGVVDSIELGHFARAILDSGAVVLDGVQCESAADAFCDAYATAQTAGCPSAPASCAPAETGEGRALPDTDPEPPTTPPFLLERFPATPRDNADRPRSR